MTNVTIRPIAATDTENIIKWRNNPNVVRNFLFQKRLTVEEHTKWLETMVKQKMVYQFIISLDNIDVGSVYLRDVDLVNKKAEFGIFIGEDTARGKGVGYNATQLILDFAFEKLNLNKVFLRVLAENTGAIKCYKKSGFKEEGCFVQEVFLNNCFKDIIFMAVFRNGR